MTAFVDAMMRRATHLAEGDPPHVSARVLRFDGLIVECAAFSASPGTRCAIETEGGPRVTGEVVGFDRGRNLLLLDQPGARIGASCLVHRLSGSHEAAVGSGLLGRVIDADGATLDGLPQPVASEHRALTGTPLNPLERQRVTEPLDVGVRLINAGLTIGRGQRLGIVAGSGVGKSVLIEMIARYTEADVIVVGLIGERAREVGDFTARIMEGPAGARTTIVAVPADRSPLLRLRAAQRTHAIAEYFRDQGQQVLLIVDSLTRVAHARREVGLALGEPPTAKGYPPSALSLIPTLLERAGPGRAGEGAITAFYTILADGDDTQNDPVVDTARAILDGHIVLSRAQAQAGIFPAIDLTASVSRVMKDIVGSNQALAAAKLRRLMASYTENRELMLLGAYAPGQDTILDEAVGLWPSIEAFAAQASDMRASFNESVEGLLALTGAHDG